MLPAPGAIWIRVSVPAPEGAGRPITYRPSCGAGEPCCLVVKLPERVYSFAVGTAGAVDEPIRNQPSPEIATSNVLPVVCSAPPVIRLSIEPAPEPRPTCAALEPPWLAFGAAPPRWSCDSESRNVMRLDL